MVPKHDTVQNCTAFEGPDRTAGPRMSPHAKATSQQYGMRRSIRGKLSNVSNYHSQSVCGRATLGSKLISSMGGSRILGGDTREAYDITVLEGDEAAAEGIAMHLRTLKARTMTLDRMKQRFYECTDIPGSCAVVQGRRQEFVSVDHQ